MRQLFQYLTGFEKVSTNPSPNTLFQIDTYDNQRIIAITEEGKMVQSNGVNATATGYGKLIEFNKASKTWSFPPGLELYNIKNVAVGESQVFALKRGKDAYISIVNFSSQSLNKYGSMTVSILELGETNILINLMSLYQNIVI